MGIASYSHWLIVGVVLLIFFGGRNTAKAWITDIGKAFKGIVGITNDVREAGEQVKGEITDARDTATRELTGLKGSMNRGF